MRIPELVPLLIIIDFKKGLFLSTRTFANKILLRFLLKYSVSKIFCKFLFSSERNSTFSSRDLYFSISAFNLSFSSLTLKNLVRSLLASGKNLEGVEAKKVILYTTSLIIPLTGLVNFAPYMSRKKIIKAKNINERTENFELLLFGEELNEKLY